MLAFVVLLALVASVALPQGVIDGLGQCLALAGDDGAAQFLAKERVEGLGQLARDAVVVADQQPLEEGHVELPPHSGRRFSVGRHAVPGPRQGALQVGLGGLEVAFNLGQPTFGIGKIGGDAVLLALEQVERHGIGVVGIQQLLTLSCQLAQPPPLGLPFALSVNTELGQLLGEEGT